MYICVCNAFSDKKVQAHLEKTSGKTKVSEVYGACSGGNSPECCSCLNTIKDMVKSHNKKLSTAAA